MESIVLTGSSKSNMSILLALAKKLGIGVKKLTMEEMEDMGLVHAMKKGRSTEYIDTDTYLKKLRGK